MNNNKVKRYLLYAIGELILITFGILVAMKINNWNEKRNFIDKANSYISEVKKDLRVDTSYFNNTIKRIDVKIDYKKSLLNQDTINKFSTKDLQSILSTGTNNISINDGAYKKIVESGILTLTEKKYLFEKLDNYYSSFNNYLQEFNKWEENEVKRDASFWVYQDHYELEYFDSIYPANKVAENRKNFLKILNSKAGINYINMSALREKTMKDIYSKASKKAEKLIKLIDSIQK